MKEENKNSNSGINGVVIAFAIFGALFAAIAFMSASTFYQILKMQETSGSDNTVTENQVQTSKPANDMPVGEFNEYMKKLQRDIKVNWNPPKKNTSLHTVLLFKIAKDGSLKEYSVYQSSGDKETDEAAIQAINLTAPFEPLPETYEKDDIDIQFTFDYNVFSKASKETK